MRPVWIDLPPGGWAQWEKAARWTGSQANEFPWGDSFDVEKFNNRYDHKEAGGGYDREMSAPVGSYPDGQSPYGCYDMAGNAVEWCQDWYVSYPGSAQPFDFTGVSRARRGCSFLHYGDWTQTRSAYRSENLPGHDDFVLGFRLAR